MSPQLVDKDAVARPSRREVAAPKAVPRRQLEVPFDAEAARLFRQPEGVFPVDNRSEIKVASIQLVHGVVALEQPADVEVEAIATAAGSYGSSDAGSAWTGSAASCANAAAPGSKENTTTSVQTKRPNRFMRAPTDSSLVRRRAASGDGSAEAPQPRSLCIEQMVTRGPLLQQHGRRQNPGAAACYDNRRPLERRGV